MGPEHTKGMNAELMAALLPTTWGSSCQIQTSVTNDYDNIRAHLYWACRVDIPQLARLVICSWRAVLGCHHSKLNTLMKWSKFCGRPPKWSGGWCIFFLYLLGLNMDCLVEQQEGHNCGIFTQTNLSCSSWILELGEEVRSLTLIHFCLLVSNAFCRGQCWPGAYQDTLGLSNAEATWGTWGANPLNKAATFRLYYCPPLRVIPIVYNKSWKRIWTA